MAVVKEASQRLKTYRLCARGRGIQNKHDRCLKAIHRRQTNSITHICQILSIINIFITTFVCHVVLYQKKMNLHDKFSLNFTPEF